MGVLCLSGHSRGMFSGHDGGSGALASWLALGLARSPRPGILKLPSLMGTNCPAPPPPLCPVDAAPFKLK